MAFRMPAEWEPHSGTWIAWPHEKSDWPGKFAAVPWVYVDIIRRLAAVEAVHILVQDREEQEKVQKVLRAGHANLPGVDFFVCPTNRSWTRDYCPIFVKDESGATTVLDWQFNGWAKYDN